MAYLRIALEKNRFIDSLVEHFRKFMKMLNVPIFSFIILNLVKEGILDPSCYYSLWRLYDRRIWKLPSLSTLKENFGSNESNNINYHSNKLVSYRSFFFTVLSYLQDSVQYKQFLVPFVDSSSRLEEKYIKKFTEWTGKNMSRSLFFHKDHMIGALLKIRHSNTDLFLRIFLKFLRTPFLQNTTSGCFFIEKN